MPKLIEYKGKKQSQIAWAKELELDPRTIQRKTKEGWSMEEIAHLKDSKAPTSGQRIKEGVRTSFEKVWAEMGQQAFEDQLKKAFAEDAIKVVKEFALYLPKDTIEKDKDHGEKAVVRIEFKQPETPQITFEGNG